MHGRLTSRLRARCRDHRSGYLASDAERVPRDDERASSTRGAPREWVPHPASEWPPDARGRGTGSRARRDTAAKQDRAPERASGGCPPSDGQPRVLAARAHVRARAARPTVAELRRQLEPELERAALAGLRRRVDGAAPRRRATLRARSPSAAHAVAAVAVVGDRHDALRAVARRRARTASCRGPRAPSGAHVATSCATSSASEPGVPRTGGTLPRSKSSSMPGPRWWPASRSPRSTAAARSNACGGSSWSARSSSSSRRASWVASRYAAARSWRSVCSERHGYGVGPVDVATWRSR